MKQFVLSLVFSSLAVSASVSHAISTAPMIGWPGYSTTVGPFTTETDYGGTRYFSFFQALEKIDKMTLDAAVEAIPAYHANKVVAPSLNKVVKAMKEVCTTGSCETDDMVKALEELTAEQ
ncbi:MAG: hypothetical protein ACXVCY_16975 [Pseudobdellovibrionaceae bacterium]